MANRTGRMAIGMNLEAIVDWSPAWTFIDAFQASRPWISQTFNSETWSTSWDAAEAPTLTLDGKGTVLSLRRWSEGGVAMQQFASTLMFRDLEGGYAGGRYRAEWEGTGEVRFGFDAQVISSDIDGAGPHHADLLVTPSSNGILLTIAATDPADPIRDIHLWMPDHQGESFAGRRWRPGDSFSPFHPLYRERLAPFGTLRFMAMQETNSSDLVRWEQRRTVDAARQNSGADGTPSEPFVNGMALELMVQLANDLDADPWFNMPHQADDDFVRQFATYVRDHLEPDRRVYVEWSNEIWNFGWGFEASQWVASQAAAAGLDPDTGQWIIAGREASRDFAIWSEVFAGVSDRELVRVASGWAAVDWVTNEIASNMNGAFDAIAIAPYITPTDAQRASYSAATTVDQVLADTRENLSTSLQWVRDHRQLADGWSDRLGRPIELLAYEGGVHLDGRDAPYQSAFYAAANDRRMGDIYADYLRGLDAAGLDLYVDFQFTGQPGATPWGDFAKFHRMDAPLSGAHRYNALLAAADGSLWESMFSLEPLVLTSPEGPEGGQRPLRVTITRSGDLSRAAAVSWSVQGEGGAPATGDDFAGGALPSGRVRFASGASRRTLRLPIAGDDREEADETFSLLLSDPEGAALRPTASRAAGTIRNDDSDPAPPRITAISVSGRQLQLRFSEAIRTDGLKLGRFGVRVDGVKRPLTAWEAIASDPSRLVLTLSGPAPGNDQAVTVTYTDPSPDDERRGVVQDSAGHDMATQEARSTDRPGGPGALRADRDQALGVNRSPAPSAASLPALVADRHHALRAKSDQTLPGDSHHTGPDARPLARRADSPRLPSADGLPALVANSDPTLKANRPPNRLHGGRRAVSPPEGGDPGRATPLNPTAPIPDGSAAAGRERGHAAGLDPLVGSPSGAGAAFNAPQDTLTGSPAPITLRGRSDQDPSRAGDPRGEGHSGPSDDPAARIRLGRGLTPGVPGVAMADVSGFAASRLPATIASLHGHTNPPQASDPCSAGSASAFARMLAGSDPDPFLVAGT